MNFARNSLFCDLIALGAVDHGGTDDGPIQPACPHVLLGAEFGLVTIAHRIGAGAQLSAFGIAENVS